MDCWEGFKKDEAKASGVCNDCPSAFCDAHPKFEEWRQKNGLLPKVTTPGHRCQQPVVQPRPRFVFKPTPPPAPPRIPFGPLQKRGGYKQGRMFRDRETSRLMGEVLRRMCEAARVIYEGEELKGWVAKFKRNVWATRCSYQKKDVQFGEGSALCHLEGGRDTVSKEMTRYGWVRTPENGWMMIVIHEVAHAVVRNLYGTGHSVKPHGFEFQSCLVSLRAKYFDRLIGMFEGFRAVQAVAANKES